MPIKLIVLSAMLKPAPLESSVSYAKGCDVQISFNGKVDQENSDGSFDIVTKDAVVRGIHKSSLKLLDVRAIKFAENVQV